MANILLEYMKNRFDQNEFNGIHKKIRLGPVITISREYGCPAKRIAGLLSSELNRIESESFSKYRWQWIGKEILDASAKELNVKSDMVKRIVNKEEMGVVDDIVMSLSHKHYPGDLRIKKKLGEVIRSFSEHGHVIIVGRGGVSIANNIPDSLHIRLQAPLEWRINTVSKNQMITLVEAKRKIHQIDMQRELIREFFEGRKVDNSCFDIIINYQRLDEDDIISTIVGLAESKNLI